MVMATTEATTVDAAGRELRVSSPDRVIFPKTDRTRGLTKLDVVEYYLAVEPGIMRALRHRPTTLERWPKGVIPASSCGPARRAVATPSSRSAPRKNLPDWIPDGPTSPSH